MLVFMWEALAEYSQMSTHVPGFQSLGFFSFFLHHFILAILATSSVQVIKPEPVSSHMNCIGDVEIDIEEW